MFNLYVDNRKVTVDELTLLGSFDDLEKALEFVKDVTWNIFSTFNYDTQKIEFLRADGNLNLKRYKILTY